MTYKPYTGIGARKTPVDTALNMAKIAYTLGALGYTLRSGGASGADRAFALGADSVKAPKEIFLPWHNFNDNDSPWFNPSQKCFSMAERFHPRWQSLNQAAQKLMARNCQQILGFDLMSPTGFVVCWTADGEASGGTGQALRIAKAYEIPIYNLQKPSDLLRLREFIDSKQP